MDPPGQILPHQPLLVFHTCETCRIFKTKSLPLMEKHLQNHKTTPKPTCVTELEPYKCRCEFESNFLVNLIAHIEQPHRIFYCRNCNCVTHSYLIFLKHKLKCVRKKITKLWFECDHCFYKTTVKQTLQRHIVAKHTPAKQIHWLQCDLCEYKAKRKDHLKTHVRCMHPQDGEKWLQCQLCSYKTTQKDRIQKHMLCKHSSDYSFHCDQCEYKSKLKYHLKTHIMSQHPPPGDIQWFQCANCAFKSKIKQALRRHIVLKHMRPKWFKCEECEFKTKKKHTLKSHVISKHEDEDKIKWFECGKCEYRAKRKGHVVRHMSTHRIQGRER